MAKLVPAPPSRETVLIGWLCIMRHNLTEQGEGVFQIPTNIRDGLADLGWIKYGEPDEDGSRAVHVTDAGCAASDMAAPEWGIDPVG